MANPLDNISETEPTRVVAGDTVQWRRDDLVTDYPPATYSLEFQGRREGDGTDAISVTATEDADGYLFSETAGNTASWTAGIYHWAIYATRTSDNARVTVATGRLDVDTNLDQSTADPRSHAKKMLDAIESLIEGRSTKDVQEYAIAGRRLVKMSVDELMKWRSYYKGEVKRENRAALGKSPRRVTKAIFRADT